MTSDQYYRYLNLPKIPQSILDQLNWNISDYQHKAHTNFPNSYLWTDQFNQVVDSWCKENICDTMYYAFQIISNDLPMHKDSGTKIKLTYILKTGGENTITEWYNDAEELVESVALEPCRWHIFKADSYHAVKNIDPGQHRFSITGRVFP
jgi:hypothetical protein